MGSAKHGTKKILAVASFGGHFVQLMRLQNIFLNYDTTFVSTNSSLKNIVPGKFKLVTDASMGAKLGLIVLACQMFLLIIKVRPDFVISTGAAPGFFALMFGKLFGAKTIWIDSIANVDELSLAGNKVRVWCDMWLTQWPHLENDNFGPFYKGSVI